MDFKIITDALQDVLPIIEKNAPAIAAAFGTPLAGTAIALLCNIFDSPKSDLPALSQKINEDPQATDKLTTAQVDLIKNAVGGRRPAKITFSVCLDFDSEYEAG
jgi:hypothetical protein